MDSAGGRVYSQLVRPVRGKVVEGVVLAALSSICSFVPYVAITRVAQIALTEGIPSPEQLVFWVVLAVCGALAGRFLFSRGTGICHYADADFRVNARTTLVDHLGKVPLGWFSDNNSAEVKQGATDDVLNMHQSIGHAPVDVTTAVLSPLLPLIYLSVVDWRLALLLLAYFVLVLGVASPFMFRNFSSLNKEYNDSVVELSSATVEMVEGISVVKTFGQTSRASRRFTESVVNLAKICYVWTKKTGGPFAVVFSLFSPASMLVVLLALSLWFLSSGWIDLASCVPFLVLGVGIPSSLVNLFSTVRSLESSLIAAEHLATILDVKPLEEPENPEDVAEDDLSVAFEDVSFSYGDEAAPALQEITADLRPDTVVALVGASGSGKTTFARLIPRFWDPESGRITLNEVGLREMLTSHVLSKVAIVFQDTVILRESIRDNIRLARPEATEDEVIDAAKKAQIHERITELPHGYDTVVGSGDGQLSGGEQQRVAIARAMLQDAPILVLDEATAHADPENEVAIQEALSNLARGRTTVVIAHRLNTIAHADQILVLGDGRVLERGRHEELLGLGGTYAALWESQQIEGGAR